MLIYDFVLSTPQDMYMYGGLILTLNIYFTYYSAILISVIVIFLLAYC